MTDIPADQPDRVLTGNAEESIATNVGYDFLESVSSKT